MLLGLFDLLAGIVFALGDTWMPGWLGTFIVAFLVIKGITTMIKFPIWFGPISFFAGIIDLLAGLTIYFTNYSGLLVTVSSVLGVFLIMKGSFTVIFGLVAG